MNRAYFSLLILLMVGCSSPKPAEPGTATSDTLMASPPNQIRHLDNPGSFTEISYHPNGKIATITKQGYVNSCSVPVGTHYFFTELGQLEQEKTYTHWVLSPDEGCHSSVIQEIYIHEFYANGQLKLRRQLQSCYECEETKFGLWATYNQQGELLSEAFFEKKFRKEN